MGVWKCAEGQSPVKQAMSFRKFLAVAYCETNVESGHPPVVPTKRPRSTTRTSFYLQWRGLPTPTQQRDLEAELVLSERQDASNGVSTMSAVSPKGPNPNPNPNPHPHPHPHPNRYVDTLQTHTVMPLALTRRNEQKSCHHQSSKLNHALGTWPAYATGRHLEG